MDAVYLHARSPADARIALYDAEGPAAAREALSERLRARLEPVDFQVLLPTEEASLRPVTVELVREGLGGRVAPALWHVNGVGLPLAAAVPHLAETEAGASSPGLAFLGLASRLVLAMLRRGEFAPAEPGGVLRFVPRWSGASIRCLGGLAELVHGSMLTARFAAAEQPVYAVTPRNLVVSFVGHALDANAGDFTPRYRTAERLPRSFWRPRPAPVLEVLRPERELEEGVPWAIQVRFRPVPGLDLRCSLERLRERVSDTVFADAIAADVQSELEAMLEEVARRVPAIRRAMNMSDGKASLNRQELDQVLDHLPLLEAEGFEITLPGLDEMQRLEARVSIEEGRSPEPGSRPWFEFHWSLAVGDRKLSDRELEQLVSARSPLAFLERGPVLLAPRDREALARFAKRKKETGRKVDLFEALRLKLGGASHLHGLAIESVESSPRLDEIVATLEEARKIEDRPQPPGFVGRLRPYQARGHAWMHFLLEQEFGACLADDMGLGKTVQAIAEILDRRQDPERRGPILLVCPVSVLGNWRRELHRFAPELRVALHHGKGRARKPEEFDRVAVRHDVILTSYNLLQRDEELFAERVFEGVVLDEAQNIKNPATRQSRVARRLKGRFRLALTGTPLENRPLDLWSIMDFLNEGLLGNRANFMRSLEHPIVKQRNASKMSTLARLVRPFVLRRLKTDPEIISDLPEKSEQVVAATLTREQAVLYESVVRRGLGEVESAGEGMERRGAILTTLLRLKQVCNHPAHFQMDGSPLPGRSGKMDLLTEMLEEALDEGDRCLVFTQFKEMGTLLKTHIVNVLGQDVLFLHGSVPQKEREEMVNLFQEGAGDGPRIFVLSLKAGGTGLNLTMANRVFHFDRWWNPAVEDQATDRAFRIGQQRNVFVHKFVCSGTLEERIQEMLERKREVAEGLLGAGEGWITELSNADLRRLLTLDRKEALA